MKQYYGEQAVEGVAIEHGPIKRACAAYINTIREAEQGTPLAAIAASNTTEKFREGFYETVRVFFDAALNEIVEIAAKNATRERGGKANPHGGRHCTKDDIDASIDHIAACRNH